MPNNHFENYILVVEDNMDDEFLIARALSKVKIPGEIIYIRDGAQAIDFLFGRGAYQNRNINHLPRFILMDVKMPKMSGLEVLEKLRLDLRFNSVPVILLSSSLEDSDLKKAHEICVNSYIHKPIDMESFSEVIQRIGYYWGVLNQTPTSN
jgi:two-component system response regulator